MKELLKILASGSVLFMVLAIAQEWEFFSGAWFGRSEPTVALSDADRAGAVDAVRQTLTLMTHLYASGGDRRFSERMPASDTVLEEMVEDIRYLGERHLVQSPSLDALEIESAKELDESRVEVRTREAWTIRLSSARTQAQTRSPERHVTRVRYLVARDGRGWRVQGWRIEPDAEPGA